MALFKQIKFRLSQSVFNSFRKNETKLHELTYLFWECTLRCSLNCLHCGSDCTQNSATPDMPADDFLRVADLISKTYKSNKITVVITGGEPLLRADLEEVGVQLKSKGFGWGIVTNGFQYTQQRHESLMKAGMGALTLSLDGLKESHNWLRNSPLSFDRALAALRIIKHEKQLNYDVVTCVNKRNISDLEELKNLLNREHVKAWRLFTIAPIGRAKNNDEMHLSNNDFRYLMDFIKIARSENKIDIKFSCEGYVGDYESQVRDGFFFCRAGINVASILIDGSISACPNIDRAFSQGTIYTDNFVAVWENKFTEMRNRQWMQSGKCLNCNRFKHCQGNGFHYRQNENPEVLQCHVAMLK